MENKEQNFAEFKQSCTVKQNDFTRCDSYVRTLLRLGADYLEQSSAHGYRNYIGLLNTIFDNKLLKFDLLADKQLIRKVGDIIVQRHGNCSTEMVMPFLIGMLDHEFANIGSEFVTIEARVEYKTPTGLIETVRLVYEFTRSTFVLKVDTEYNWTTRIEVFNPTILSECYHG